MNVMIFYTNPNDNEDEPYKEYAVVPIQLLNEYDLDEINGSSTQNLNHEIGDQVAMLFDRLGVYPFIPCMTDEEREKNDWHKKFVKPPFTTQKDLKKFVNLAPPFTIDKVISIDCG